MMWSANYSKIATRPIARVAVLYQDFLVRCRIRRVPGEALALPAFRRKLAVVRAGVAEETAQSESWQTALALSTQLSDDVQGVFLVLARAAVEALPCPSDATLARAYGTTIRTGRARRLLTYFEERGLLVVRMDLRNQRIVAFPDLGAPKPRPAARMRPTTSIGPPAE